MRRLAHSRTPTWPSRLLAWIGARRGGGAGAVTSAARSAQPIAVRLAAPGDRPALERLAALDERSLPGGELLVAEVDGALWAALEPVSGDSVANPFVPSADAVELLRLRVRQLRASPRAAAHMEGEKRRQASATVGS